MAHAERRHPQASRLSTLCEPANQIPMTLPFFFPYPSVMRFPAEPLTDIVLEFHHTGRGGGRKEIEKENRKKGWRKDKKNEGDKEWCSRKIHIDQKKMGGVRTERYITYTSVSSIDVCSSLRTIHEFSSFTNTWWSSKNLLDCRSTIQITQ